ncbi:MAG TPA: hypothetical protein VMI31_06380, partial [Fimbriimonadaceae bacterium]|nr:hypothetical protein [Fimbriimonadaceae bacterium]
MKSVMMAAALATLGFAFQRSPAPDEAVSRFYDGQAYRIEGIGVCDIEPDAISCWTMDGNSDGDLAARLSRYFQVHSERDLRFKVGMKSRWLVVSESPGTPNVMLDGEGTGSGVEFVDDRILPRIELVQSVTKPDATRGSVGVTFLQIPGPPAVELPLRPGARVAYGGSEIQVGPWRQVDHLNEAQSQFYHLPVVAKRWHLTFECSAPSSRSTLDLSYELLDKSGMPIRYVDLQGKPLSELELVTDADAKPAAPYFLPEVELLPTSRTQRAVFSMFWPLLSGLSEAFTNVDPASIGSIRISSTAFRRIRIDGFPLDPSNARVPGLPVQAPIASGRYEGPEGARIEGLGVCEITPERLDCWDMNGSRSDELSDQVRRILESSPAPDVPFRTGEKTRYLIVRESLAGNRIVRYGGNLEPIYVFSAAEPSTAIIPVSCAPGLAETGLELTIEDDVHAPAAMVPLRAGSKTSVGGVEVTIGPVEEDWKPVPNQPFVPWTPYSLAWKVAIESLGPEGHPQPWFEFIGRDSKPIEYVDLVGKPVSADVFSKWYQVFSANPWSSSDGVKYAWAGFARGTPATEDAAVYFFNADPKWIKGLRVLIPTQRQVTITGFPL